MRRTSLRRITSASFFTVLRTQAQLGRVFTDAECQPGRDSVALLNYGFWQRRFAADPTVLGRKIELDQRTYSIIGVMPKNMQYPSVAEVYLPFAPNFAATCQSLRYTTTSSPDVCATA